MSNQLSKNIKREFTKQVFLPVDITNVNRTTSKKG